MARAQEQLSQWLEALTHYVEMTSRPRHHEVDEALQTGVVWLQWAWFPPLNEAFPDDFLDAYTALEALALLARADYDAWIDAIGSVWPRATQTWVNLLSPRTFELGVIVYVTQAGQLSRWAERAFAPDPECADILKSEYQHGRHGFAEPNENRADRLADIRVRFVLGNDAMPDYVASSLLFEALQLARTQAARQRDDIHGYEWKTFFRLVDLEGEVFIQHLDVKDILCVHEITLCGVAVARLDLYNMEMPVTPLVVHRIARLQRAIAWPEAPKCARIDCVTVNSMGSPQTLDGIFSAVFYSRSIRSLVFDTPMESEQTLHGTERLLLWLALCVFDGKRSPAMDTVAICVDETEMDNVHTLALTLQEGSAYKRLFPDANDDPEIEHMLAKASKFLLTRPSNPSEALEVCFPDELENLRLITLEDDYVSVLLPGWGQAWVRHRNVVLEQTSEDKVPPPRNQVHQLMFECVPVRRLPVLLELLRTVGAGVQALTISWENDILPLSHEWIRSVCLACPDLIDLHLDLVHCGTLEVLASCYNDGICHAKRLALKVFGAGPDPSVRFPFFDHLESDDHAMTRHLRDITLKIRNATLSDQIAEMILSAATMLHVNEALLNLDLRLQFVGNEPRDQLDTVSLTLCDGQSLPVRAAPLAIDCKVAFLSVVSEARSPTHFFDAHVVSRIFEYAAKCKKRRVQVSVK